MYVFQLIKINNMRLTLIFNFALLILNLKGQSYKGLIMDYKTSKPIAYANIGIPSKGYGVVCNEQGEFNLKITNEKDSDIVQVFSIGYKPVYITISKLKTLVTNEFIYIGLDEASYQLATVNVRPNDYETKIVGSKDVSEFECEGSVSLAEKKDTATLRKEREQGISNKSIGVELGNKIRIDKGQQTFIDKIRFKTCLKPNDTCIYRINIYKEESTKERHMTPIGMVKIINTSNILKAPLIVKVIGKSEVQELDLSNQNVSVDDDFIIAIECIYTSNNDMNIAYKTSIFGSTDLLIRPSTMAEWVKIPLLDITFVSATVTYKKKKGFFYRLFD